MESYRGGGMDGPVKADLGFSDDGIVLAWTLGGWAYDVLHPGWADMNAPRAAVTDPLDFINSPNPNSSSTWGA